LLPGRDFAVFETWPFFYFNLSYISFSHNFFFGFEMTSSTSSNAAPKSRKTDVLICGSGSAGLCAAVWLARLGIDFIVLERRNGPLNQGQADGVQCRTVEIFQSLGLDHELTRDAYWVNEVCFWAVGDEEEEKEKEGNSQAKGADGVNGVNGEESKREEPISRLGRTQDVPKGLSWQPHVILNQAGLNALLIQDIKKHHGSEIQYGMAVKDIRVDSEKMDDPNAYPVAVTAEKDGGEYVFEAKYALVGDYGYSCRMRHSLSNH
jgi:phenol 2-monooxygenase (NADPH)